jgi:hypothetical protein
MPRSNNGEPLEPLALPPRLSEAPIRERSPDVATLVRPSLNEFQLVENDCCDG